MSSDVANDGKRTPGPVAHLCTVTSTPVTAVLPAVTTSGENAGNTVTDYEIPPWAGRPPSGCHLDVVKGDQLIQVCRILMKSFTKLYRPRCWHLRLQASLENIVTTCWLREKFLLTVSK